MGALRRRLSIVLTGLVAPDRVWAIIRGVTPAAAAGDGQRLIAQRLDFDESHLSGDFDILCYSELNDDRRERRKIDIYPDGRSGFADEQEEAGGPLSAKRRLH